MKRIMLPLLCCLLWSSPRAVLAGPGFAREPSAVQAGKAVKIAFAVSAATDVAVTIENEKGEIVRHLVAGVLGKTPPAPLQANSLEQNLTWDGNDDDGKPAGGGPFRVRVGLGTQINYAGMAFTDQTGPNHVSSVLGMGVGPDGRLYVLNDRSGWLYWPAMGVCVFQRDGSYEKTTKPFPAHLPLERLKGLGAFQNADGHLNPLMHRTQGMTLYPFEDESAGQLTVTPDSNLILPVVPSQAKERGDYRGTTAHLAAIDRDGGIPYASYAGPALGLAYHGEAPGSGPYLQASGDGKAIYLSNVGNRVYEKGYKLNVHPAIYKAPLPNLGPATIFFGDKEKTGGDQTGLKEPRGLALDGNGHLLVADHGNNRIVVLKEADASYVNSFAVDAPQWIGVHRKSGAVYVQSAKTILKFTSWKDPKRQASLDLEPFWKGLAYNDKFAQRICCAIDASADVPVLWLGLLKGEKPLYRCEDRDGRFTEPEPAKCFRSPRQWRPASDPLHQLVACRVGTGQEDTLRVLDERTGQVRKLSGVLNHGELHRLGPDGAIYAATHARGIFRYDPDSKPKPFSSTADAADAGERGRLPNRAGATGTTAWDRDFSVDRRGDIYVKIRGREYHGLMHVDVFGQDGKRQRTVLWGVTDGAYGPRVDSQGNLYLMECVKPVGEPFPKEFVPHATDRWVQHWYDWVYGSVVKFSPKGGNLFLSQRNDNDRPNADPVALPASVAKEKVYATFRKGESLMQGALWWQPGFAHLGDMGIAAGGEHCHCTGCDFDVDNFGRTFAPDNGRFRVGILDTNGNVILHFGAYGNQDFCGPDSYVLDPRDKTLRPRKADDPKDLVSPFAAPAIAFKWIVGLAVTEHYVYVADSGNRRVLRCRLGYAIEKTAAIR
jgi:hypothetical protein